MQMYFDKWQSITMLGFCEQRIFLKKRDTIFCNEWHCQNNSVILARPSISPIDSGSSVQCWTAESDTQLWVATDSTQHSIGFNADSEIKIGGWRREECSVYSYFVQSALASKAWNKVRHFLVGSLIKSATQADSQKTLNKTSDLVTTISC